MIARADAARVLEVGAGDYSFDYVRKRGGDWLKLDFAQPCDIVCNINEPDLVLPLHDGAFDLIICTEVLEHLLWPQVFLREAHRALKPDGQILVSVPNIVSLSYRIAWMTGHLPSCAATGNIPVRLAGTGYAGDADEEPVGGHVIDFNVKRITGLLRVSGFKTVSIKGSGIIWYAQLLPHWLVPPSLSSNIICLARKDAG
jgi:SAM-dependent methyltransferase